MHSEVLDLEFDLVVSASLATARGSEILASRADEIDWHRVRALADRHRVDSLVLDRLSREAGDRVPKAVMADLEQTHQANVFDYLLKCSESLRLCEQLRSAGAPSIILKGCTIAERYYRPTPAMRFASDIDLLVAPAALNVADVVLSDLGYERLYPSGDLTDEARSAHHRIDMHYLYVHRETQQAVELHHRLIGDSAVMASRFEVMLERSIPIPLGGGTIRALNDADGFAYCCHHGARHAFERIKWLADCARMAAALQPAETEEAIRIAAAGNCQRSIVLTCAMLERLGCRQIPASLGQRRSEVAALERHVVKAMKRDVLPEGTLELRHVARFVGTLLFDLRLAETWQSRWNKVVRFLVLRSDIDRLRLSARWIGVYALIGWPRAMTRFAWRKAFGPGRE